MKRELGWGKGNLGLGSFLLGFIHISQLFLLTEGVVELQKELACGLVEQFA